MKSFWGGKVHKTAFQERKLIDKAADVHGLAKNSFKERYMLGLYY